MLEIIRYLFRHKARTLLTVLAVAVGIFAVTTIGGITEEVESLLGDVESSAAGRILMLPTQFDRPLTEQSLRDFRKVEGVAGVTVTISDYMQELDEGGVVIPVNPEMFSGTRSDITGLEFEPPMGVELWAGRIPGPNSRTETVVTWDIAQKYGLEVGDEFVIRERPFRVVGIWGYVATASLRAAYISYDAAEQLATENPFRGVGTVYVIPLPGVDVEELCRRIENQLDTIQAMSPAEMVTQTRMQMLIFTLITGTSGILALLIGTFTIVNTMIVSVHERRREIGLKKALGAADSHILAEVVAQAALVGGLGGLVGVLGGLGVTFFANRALFESIGLYLFLITPRLAVGAVVFTVLMGVIAGIYPAWQAARLDPVVALRGGGGALYAARGFNRWVYLLRRNGRAILTILGIAIGIFALVALGSMAEYINSFVNDAVNGAHDKVLVYTEDADVPFGRSTAGVLGRIPGVRAVVLSGGSTTIDEEASMFTLQAEMVYGVESPTGEYGYDMPMEVAFAAGRNLAPGSLTEVVVGAELARKHHLHVGDTFTIRDHDFTVVGIWKRIPHDLSSFNLRAYITLDAMSVVLKQPSTIGSMTALLAPNADPEQVAQAIEEALPGVKTQTAEATAAEIRQVFTILIAVMAGLLSIAVFVSSVSVANTMIIAVYERTREIGLKKAVGASDADILAEIVADAGKLGALGGVVGVALAAVLVLVVNALFQASTGVTALELTPRLALGSVIFSAFLGMAAGLIPAWRAARLDPVVALRTE